MLTTLILFDILLFPSFFLHLSLLKGVSSSRTWRTKSVHVDVSDLKGIQMLLGMTNGLRISAAAAAAAFPSDERLYNSSEGPIFIIEEHTL